MGWSTISNEGLEYFANEIIKSFNAKKTVCKVFNPSDRHKDICNTFPVFNLAGCNLLFYLFILFYLILQDVRNYGSIKNGDKNTRRISLVFTGYKYKTTTVKPYYTIN